jgi:DNA-binding GntR family transcriptional regulator
VTATPAKTNPTPAADRSTVVQRIAHQLREGVREGQYAPGQRLVEADLTRSLGVSRGPLREALGRLATEGIVELEPYRGAVVRRLTREDVASLFQVREVLEGQAAALAAARIGAGDNRRRFQRAITAIDAHRTRDDVVAYMDENSRFHDLILELSGNTLLCSISAQLSTPTFRLQFRDLLGARSRNASIREHDQIAEAVLAGDAKAAERAMRKHVRSAGERSIALAD